MQISTALKTVIGICELYNTESFIDLGNKIAIYNAIDDNFHIYRWSAERGQYVWDGMKDNIPEWQERRIKIFSCTK